MAGPLIVHNCAYGAGPKKIHETLSLSGVSLSFKEVKQIHAEYWKLYAGIKEWDSYLNQEWDRNGGWVLNGIGRPLTVSADLKKDLVNRVCQSTGHDILMMVIAEVHRLVSEQGVPMRPIIINFHDEMLMETDAGQEQQLCEIVQLAFTKVNQRLGGTINLKCSGGVIGNIADAKIS